MKGWIARAVRAPGTVSFRRYRRVVDAAIGRRSWAETLQTSELAAAAREAAGSEARRGGVEPSADLLAVLREAARRTVGQEPFAEQFVAACAIMAGYAVEMDTGEGKTLAGALAAAGFAVSGRRVHVLSVNDYLAERDAQWMRPLFDVIGITVDWVGQSTDPADRRTAYGCDVVYAPVSEVGYDVLRDRFATTAAERVAPTLDVAIVDEADAVMIDEAMSPLVLAGSSPDAPDDVALADALVRDLDPRVHFAIDADHATVTLTDAGLDALEQRLGGVNLYASEHTATLTRLNLALHAHELVRRDVDYIVADGRITLVNTARGRLAHSQRWPDGLHAAVEAKEQLAVSSPGVILDTLTVQDLLRGYDTVTGMSGTVVAVAEELVEFYEVKAGRVDRRLPNRRIDQTQRVFVHDADRLAALVREVAERHDRGQPILVGTQSVAESERVAVALAAQGIPVSVLNARNDAHEAEVIASAGAAGAVTISTQMSGRGTDIRLGGADERDHDLVGASGGLAVLQVGRYPSGRLDAQLWGRSGRQGDPGETLAFVSLDDELVEAHAPKHHLERIRRAGDRVGQDERAAIVDQAQRIAEGGRRDRHRDTWEFTRATSRQRNAVLARRQQLMDADDVPPEIDALVAAELSTLSEAAGAAEVTALVREVTLWCIDDAWCAHLAHLAEIRDGIHLQALAGLNPRDEFHRIALREFQGFFDGVWDRSAEILRTVTADQVGADLVELGLRRPSATWTYMVSDNPLGSPMDRGARRAGAWLRSRVYRIE